MDNAKVVEMLNQTVMTEYLQKLLGLKLNKLTLYPVFPITAAPNVSDPYSLIMIEDIQKFAIVKKTDLN
ncbi:MAG TPA: hypothetical protein VMD02_07245 [Candidatus Omnitrophota bacterium]|nr:hypothetical protein [Candidatus Omnitrophota bacterium]